MEKKGKLNSRAQKPHMPKPSETSLVDFTAVCLWDESRTDKEALEELHNLVIILSGYSRFTNVDWYKNFTVSKRFLGHMECNK